VTQRRRDLLAQTGEFQGGNGLLAFQEIVYSIALVDFVWSLFGRSLFRGAEHQPGKVLLESFMIGVKAVFQTLSTDDLPKDRP
jgi:hypothetical protein